MGNLTNSPSAGRQERTHWFQADRFGMFIHWGLYAIPARGEWVRSIERIRNEDYQPYFAEFNGEDCITLNNNWGYCAADHNYKSAGQIIRALVECISKNGNLLVNVGSME